MTDTTDTLLSAFTLKDVPLRNRLAVAPMTRVSATEDGEVTDIMARYYERFARGGFGLVITEGLYTDQAWSQGYLYQPGISDDAQAHSWREPVGRMHAHGAAVIAQIMHSGALTQANRFRPGTIAPSAVLPKGEQLAMYYGKGGYAMPSAMTDAQIDEVITGFSESARRAVSVAGFDGVELHAANGYLLDQFLSAHTNLREDRWGGDARQRLSLLVEIIQQARAAMGDHGVLGIRVSQGKVNDFQARWANGDAQAEVIFGTLADAGVDYIHTTEYKAWQPAFAGHPDSLADLARRYAPGVAIIANGDLHQFEEARALLARGTHLVAVGKAAMANPDLPRKLAANHPLHAFTPELLAPIANVKEAELADA